MPPRFMERISRNSETLQAVFGESECEPPSYASTRVSVASSASSSARQSSGQIPQRPILTPPPRYNLPHQPQRPSLDDVVVPKDSLILVTGANSFQGLHIVDQLLACGYRVRGTVRDDSKAAWTSKFFDDKYGAGHYTTTLVPEMEVLGSYHEAVRNCVGVVHVASVTATSSDPNKVITPSIAGAINLLEAAATEPSVVRVVQTSSIAAAVPCERVQGWEISTHTWNMTDFNVAWAPPPFDERRLLAVRSSAKMQTEAAVWRWHEVHKPNFTINTVLPDILWGKLLTPEHKSYSLSAEILKTIHHGTVPYYPPSHFINVQDSALLHVAALLLPDVEGQRIFAVGTSWDADALVNAMFRLYPRLSVHEDPLATRTGLDKTIFREADVAVQLLHRMGKDEWTDLETSVKETCEGFLSARS